MSTEEKEKHVHKTGNSNICTICGEAVHVFNEPRKIFSTKSIDGAANRLDKAANKAGVALVLFVLGIFIFPPGIIPWLFAAGVLFSVFSPNTKG